jgi:hypothetical protein
MFKDLANIIKLLRSDINTQSDMLYKIIKAGVESEENMKYTIKLLVLACQKYPDFKDILKKYVNLINTVLEHV